MTGTAASAHHDWPFVAATAAFVLAALAVVWYLALLAPTDAPSVTAHPEATWPAIPAVVPLIATYPTDSAGLLVVVLATATVPPSPPTPTEQPYVWPTATMATDASGDLEVR